jgi:hypothetical protein
MGVAGVLGIQKAIFDCRVSSADKNAGKQEAGGAFTGEPITAELLG